MIFLWNCWVNLKSFETGPLSKLDRFGEIVLFSTESISLCQYINTVRIKYQDIIEKKYCCGKQVLYFNTYLIISL